MLFRQRLELITEREPERPAVLFDDSADGGRRRTFGEHWLRVGRIQAALAGRGVTRTTTFAAIAGNGAHLLELFHAALCGHGTIVPINFRLSEPEIHAIISASGSELVFVDRAHQHLVPALSPMVRAVVVLDGPDSTWEEELGQASASPARCPAAEETPLVLFTGGSTGTAKGTLLSQRALAADIDKMTVRLRQLGDGGQQVFLHQNAMFHSSALVGITYLPTAGGASCFVPRFDAEAVRAAVRRHRATLTSMIPTTMQMLLDATGPDNDDLASLDAVCYGGSAISASLVERFGKELTGVRLFGGYGMTEACGHVTNLEPADHRPGSRHLRSSGRAFPGTTVTAVDADGRTLPDHRVGELVIDADNLMDGYLGNPAETSHALRNGRFHTGDLGYLDDGYVYVVGRLKDMIVTGGENVYAGEVESVVAQHPGVAQVAVFGIPDPRWGEAIHATVVPHAGARLDLSSITSFCQGRIASYKTPKSIEIRTHPLPTAATNKIDKSTLRAEFHANGVDAEDVSGTGRP